MISLDEKVKKIVELIEDKKGQEIKIYDLQGKSPFFDYSILCTGSSSRNIDAIATDIKKGLGDVKSIEGLGECNWVLIDSGDILISYLIKMLETSINWMNSIKEILIKRRKKTKNNILKVKI